jgi:hypothetical protein
MKIDIQYQPAPQPKIHIHNHPAATPRHKETIMTRTIRTTTTKLHWLLAGLFTALLIAPAMLQAAPNNKLQSGEVIRGLDARRGQTLEFRIYVPRRAERLTVRAAGGQGDADLYIRHAGRGRAGGYDGRSARPDSEERVVIDNPAEGWWDIQLVAFSRFRDVALKAVVQTRGGGHGHQHGIITLHDGRPVRNLDGQRGQEIRFRIDVPRRTDRLEIRSHGGAGDVDLFLARGELPQPRTAEYRSASQGNNERIVVDNPAPGEWFVVMYSYERFGNVDLVARMETRQNRRGRLQIIQPQRNETFRLGDVMTIRWQHRHVDRVNILYSLDNGWTWQLFRDNLNARDNGLQFRLPDEDRFVSDAVRIRIEDADDRRIADTSGRFEIRPRHDVHWPWDRGGHHRHERHDRHEDVDVLHPGRVIRDMEIDDGESKTFRIFVPDGARRLEFLTGGGEDEPVQMFVDLGQLPSRNAPLRSTRPGPVQRIDVPNPRAGWWYVTLRAPDDEVEELDFVARIR